MCFGLHASKRKRSSYEERQREGRKEGCVSVRGRPCREGSDSGSTNQLHSLLCGTESLSLLADQTRGQLTSWWCKEAKLHTHACVSTHTHARARSQKVTQIKRK